MKKNPYKTYFSPAKLNLFFKVIKKREDGFHEIASLYQAIDVGDYIHVRKSNKDSFSSDFKLPFDDSNLIYKALKLFREKTKQKFFVDIILDKNIPVQAGLGGGSSNAATTLFALNEMANNPLSIQELKDLGAIIGSDVSFFLSSGTAFCTGRGEIIEDVLFQPLDFFIAKPSFGLCTKKVYQNVDLNLLEKRDHKKILDAFLMGNHEFFNDLEISSFSIEPKLKMVRDLLLKCGFEKVCMTGSGTAFFCFKNLDVNKIEGLTLFKSKAIFRKDPFWYSK